MFSVVLPVGGNLGFYLELMLANIADTCGLPMTAFDMVVLTPAEIGPNLQKSIEKCREKYHFRVLAAPIKTQFHLYLLDWAVQQDLCEWILPTHSDILWIPNKVAWLKECGHTVALYPDKYVMALSPDVGYYSFLHKGRKLCPMYDHVGLYNRDALRKHGLKFMWGAINDLKLSEPVVKAIENKEFTYAIEEKQKRGRSSNFILMTDELDGSQALSLEFGLNFQDKIIVMENIPQFIHFGCYARVVNSMKRFGRFIEMELNKERYESETWRWGVHAWMCSMFMDKDEYRNEILPWKLLENTVPTIEHRTSTDLVREITLKYFEPVENRVGLEDTFGLNGVRLQDCVLGRQSLMI